MTAPEPQLEGRNPVSGARVKLLSVEFGQPAFRKLKDQKVEIADRLTIIAGLNGVGKSSILAFIANGSGLTQPTSPRSYFNRKFQSHFHEILYLDYESEVDLPRSRDRAQVFLDFEIASGPFRRRASLSRRPSGGEDLARVVNRRVRGAEQPVVGGAFLGDSAKVPLPTIYLGMTRMLPIGETDHVRLQSASGTMSVEDANAHIGFINAVIPGSAQDGVFTDESIKLTRKRSMHPSYGHPTRAVSLGQDSISAIATAVVSFERLKRELGDSYPGGLLVIDELDAGFHPDAQQRLVAQLQSVGRRLDLQIVATTHALPTIAAAHPDLQPKSDGVSDSVLYLMNRAAPTVSDRVPFTQIRADMELAGPAKTPVVEVLVEDDEAAEFFKALHRNAAVQEAIVDLEPRLEVVSLQLGNDQLSKLASKTSSFSRAVIVLDGDSGRSTAPNLLLLPGGASGEKLSPEQLLHRFVTELCAGDQAEARTVLNKKISTDKLEVDFIEGAPDIGHRAKAKKWWVNRRQLISDYGLLDLWVEAHPDLARAFATDLVECVDEAARG